MTQDSQDEMEVMETGRQDLETGDLDAEGQTKTVGFMGTSRRTRSRTKSIRGVLKMVAC